ncbi:hypothetical protein RI054_09g46890 [Pseudoscourfieldia marina]
MSSPTPSLLERITDAVASPFYTRRRTQRNTDQNTDNNSETNAAGNDAPPADADVPVHDPPLSDDIAPSANAPNNADADGDARIPSNDADATANPAQPVSANSQQTVDVGVCPRAHEGGEAEIVEGTGITNNVLQRVVTEAFTKLAIGSILGTVSTLTSACRYATPHPRSRAQRPKSRRSSTAEGRTTGVRQAECTNVSN